MFRSLTVALAIVTMSTVLGACGSSGTEDLTSCTETETGYRVVHRSKGMSCEKARAVLGLLGSAEHGVQTVESSQGAWTCHVFPTEAGEIKYRCRNGLEHFDVRAEAS